MKLAFAEHGNGAPVVLLHSFPLSKTMWRDDIKPFTEKGFRLILPDFRGFGRSADASANNSVEEMARDVSELLDFLKIEKAVIGGLSMGGYVTFNLYRLFPEKFAGLILCDTNSAADTDEKRKSRRELIEKIRSQGFRALIEDMLPNLVSDFTKTNNPKLVAEIEKQFSEVKPESAISALCAMAERKDHTDVLDKIDVPTALIFGEEDRITNLQSANASHKQIKNSRLYTVKNAGHYSNLEQPEQFNKILSEKFLQEVKF